MRRLKRETVHTAVFIVIMAAVLLYSFLVRPWFLNWGSRPVERTVSLPGAYASSGTVTWGTRAVTVKAPPDKVWAWLVQIGQERAGFYSYTWLENMTLADIHNTEVIRPEWQTREVGDFVRGARPDYLFGLLGARGEGVGWRIAFVERERALTLRDWGTFVLEKVEPGSTRFYARSMGKDMGPVLRMAAFYVIDPAHFIMEKRMMLEIKRLAEGRPGPPKWLLILATVGFAAGALAATAATFSRKRNRPWIILPVVYAALIIAATSDLVSALVGFAALSVLIAGFVTSRKQWWMFLGLAWIAAYAVFFLAEDAFIAFGLIFLAASLVWGAANPKFHRSVVNINPTTGETAP